MSNTKDTPMDYKQFEGHTVGPWRPSAIYSRVVSNDVEICEVSVNHKEEAFSYDEWRANSRLLAAAPDLLKENQELKLELQKQKEINAELVKALTAANDTKKNFLKKLPERLLPSDWTDAMFVHVQEIESLIKKSSEV